MTTVQVDSLPVSVVTGFLGSGKTTLLNRLIQHPEMDRTAVVINEFGEIGIDNLLVEHVDDDVVLMSSGCLCCTIRGDLVDTLKDLFKRRAKQEIPDFDRLVIDHRLGGPCAYSAHFDVRPILDEPLPSGRGHLHSGRQVGVGYDEQT